DDGDAGQDEGEEDPGNEQRQPAERIDFGLRAQASRHVPELRVLFQVPADPDDQEDDPENLDRQEDRYRMVEPPGPVAQRRHGTRASTSRTSRPNSRTRQRRIPSMPSNPVESAGGEDARTSSSIPGKT